jgi:hypothetical protein
MQTVGDPVELREVVIVVNMNSDFLLLGYVSSSPPRLTIFGPDPSYQSVAIGVTIVSCLAMPHGWGSHQWTIKMKQLFDLLYVCSDNQTLVVITNARSTLMS